MADSYDMVVVGTGTYGLAAARAWIELHPSQNIAVLEAESSIGGTWGQGRMYPGLQSNNLYGTYEFPDFPMTFERYGVKVGQHIPGTTMHKYMTDFAKRYGIYDRTQFGTSVIAVQRQPNGGWAIRIKNSEKGEKTIHSAKLILSTGLTSTPNLPKYEGADEFSGPIFHSKDFALNGATTKTANNVTIVGGGKSSFDIAWAYADAGAQVDLVIRPDGNGPVWISHPWVMGGKKQLEKLLHVRWMTWFSPCPFGAEGGYSWPRRFLHGTAVGRWIVDQFWSALAADVVTLNGYDSHPETKKLKPWNSAFWIGSGLSIHNFPTNLFDMVKEGKIRVHIDNIDHLSKNTVHLAEGESLKADLIICATGWRKEPTIKYVDFGPSGIGLGESQQDQKLLAARADDKILRMFPRLKDQPKLKFEPKTDPLRLYRFMVPPTRVENRDIAFAGMVSTVSTAICATIQGLWISAFLDGKVDRLAKTPDEITSSVMLHTQWGRWRHPTGYGAMFPDFVFDSIPYMDLLLNDLSIKANRKKGWFADISAPYGVEDYKDLIDEWLENQQRSQVKV